MMTAAAIFSALESYRFIKKSGMVAVSRCWVMTRVRLPSTFHASSEPMKALPRPIHVEAIPNFHPN